jgi:hypothetical protein
MNRATTLRKAARVAREKTESHAVEPGDAAQIEDDPGECAFGVIQCGVQGALVFAIDNAAGALNHVDASDVAGA